MPRQRKADAGQISALEVQVKTAPCVPAIRQAVEAWRGSGYTGATHTSRILLNHWFHTDHRLRNGTGFRYHHSQREAVETLIYLYEVAKVRRQKELLETYATAFADLRLLQHDQFTRYAIKMATGSGKTKVMALAIAWSYFNAVLESPEEYAATFLVIAPNVIVFDRLSLDFAGGRVFRTDPVIPPELDIFWDLQTYLRGEGERAGSSGALYLTNIQQLYQRQEDANGDEPDIMTAMLGPKPRARMDAPDDFADRIAARGGRCLVLNDEAHHTHDEASEWNQTIRRLHASLPDGLAAQLDFSATPRYSKGSLFTWTVYDYPLKQAILDNIVKRPIKGLAKGIREQPSDVASTRYEAYLTAGVERWREYREQLAPLAKKPILFLMLNDTSDADDVGDYLRTKYPQEFAGEKLLVIHTKRSGEISDKDLDKARTLAREVDSGESPVNAIVSVLMLREGWDVQNVTVVVGLRPYSAKANILPEQTVGRGLRLMFRGEGHAYTERLDVIGNKTFMEFVEQLERDEELELGSFEIGKDRLVITTIQPDPGKLDRDIGIPVLTPILARKKTLAEEIRSIDVDALSCPRLPRKPGDEAERSFNYEGTDIITLEKLVEREYRIPEAQTSQEVISYYAKRIAQDVKLPSQFAELVPKVRAFLARKAFGVPVDLDDPMMIKAISRQVAQHVTVKTFTGVLRGLVVEQRQPELIDVSRKLSATQPFPYSRPTMPAAKTVFNLVTCDNRFEGEFARFLQDAPDVASFAKLPRQFGFAIEYTDTAGNLRYYEPDFVAELNSGDRFLIETKGREDIDVAHKDRAAQIWCEHATLLSGAAWRYLKVPQSEYESLQPADFEDLLIFAVDAIPTDTRSAIERLIAEGECDTLEFKSSARWDMRENKRNPIMERVIVKTVAGFLNSRTGGTLLIGVDDEGRIVGIEHDLQTLDRKPNHDGYALFLNTLLLNAVGKDLADTIAIRFPKAGATPICEVSIRPAPRAVFVKDEKGEAFYIRANNQTMPLSMQEALNYCRMRWP